MKLRTNRGLLLGAYLAALTFLPAAGAEAPDVSYLKSGDFPKAKKFIEAALAHNQNSAPLHCNLGIALLRMRNYSEALDHLHTAVGLEPGLSAAWLNLAACYLCLGELDRSIDAYQRVQTLQPASAASLAQLIAIIQKVKSVDETTTDYFEPTWRRWKHGSTIKLFIANSKFPNYKSQFQRIALESMEQAVQATDAQLKVEVVPVRAEANVICDWIAPPDSMAPLERGIATGKALNGKIVNGAVQIYLGNESGLNCLTEDTVRKSCLHEFCHVLGVAGHSANREDIMFPLIESPTVENKLTSRDKQTLRRLYAQE